MINILLVLTSAMRMKLRNRVPFVLQSKSPFNTLNLASLKLL